MNAERPRLAGRHLRGWAALCAVIAGSLLLALPDEGPRLIAFSGAHGLTMQDALGTALLVAAWAVFVTALLRPPASRARLKAWRRRSEASFAAGLGAGLVVASAVRDFRGWWAVGAVLLIVVQGAAYRAASASNGER